METLVRDVETVIQDTARVGTITKTTSSLWKSFKDNSPDKCLKRGDASLSQGMNHIRKYKGYLTGEQVDTMTKEHKELCVRRNQLRTVVQVQRKKIITYSRTLRRDTALYEEDCEGWNQDSQQSTSESFRDRLREEYGCEASSHDDTATSTTDQSESDRDLFGITASDSVSSSHCSERTLVPHDHHEFSHGPEHYESNYIEAYEENSPHHSTDVEVCLRRQQSLAASITRNHWVS